MASAVVRLDGGQLEAAEGEDPRQLGAQVAAGAPIAGEDLGARRGALHVAADAREVRGVGEAQKPTQLDGGLTDRPDLPVDERGRGRTVEQDVAEPEVAVDDRRVAQ